MMTEKAVLAVSFGTSHPRTRERTIGAIEQALARAFPERRPARAFTSPTIRRLIKKNEGIDIDDVRAALEKLAADGVGEVLVQPTFVIGGEEYGRVCAEVRACAGSFHRVCAGRPLLSARRDFERTADALAGVFAGCRGEGTAIVLMGHGSRHAANSAYEELQRVFDRRAMPDFLVGTVEASPGISDILRGLKERFVKRAVLAPFMVVAGEHAVNDMAGEEDSWRCVLARAGIEVTCVLKGLGECAAIQEIYVEHAREAER